MVFSDSPIDFPHLTTADILVVMSQGAYDAQWAEVNPETGLILYDTSQVTPRAGIPVRRQIGIPAVDRAIKDLGGTQTANIVLLGALLEITGLVSPEAITRAMEKHVAERFLSLNLKALKLGRELGRQAHG